MKTEKCFIQVQATKEERSMLAEVAASRDLTMSQLVRHWIRDSHARKQNKEAASRPQLVKGTFRAESQANA